VGAAALGTAGCWPVTETSSPSAGAAAKTRTYRSRPDLKVPIITTSSGAAGAASGRIFLAPGGPMIADDNGDAIWFHPMANKNVANFRAQVYASNPVLTWWEGKVGKGYALSGELVIADTTYKELVRVAAGHGYQADLHEFQITPRDTAYLTAYREVPADLTSVGGPINGSLLDGILQEVDIASGQVLFEWHSLGNVGLDESHATFTNAQPFDYFHINSIDVDTDGNLLVSARNTWAVYKISRSSGAVIWRMGGKKSSFAMATGTTFAWQHDARRQPDGTITLFDDGAAPKVEPQSRGLVLNVDEGLMEVTLRQAYTHGGSTISASSQGNMQVLPNGDVMVGWGSEPYFTEFNANGDQVLDGKLAGTFQSYRAFRLPWTGQPSDKPSVATAKADGGVTVYASWNGATGVSRWEALGGTDVAGMKVVGSAARSGFETTIKVSGQPAYVVARALDANGAVLGTSSIIGP
jgi:arylsulfotransferase ASST